MVEREYSLIEDIEMSVSQAEMILGDAIEKLEKLAEMDDRFDNLANNYPPEASIDFAKDCCEEVERIKRSIGDSARRRTRLSLRNRK